MRSALFNLVSTPARILVAALVAILCSALVAPPVILRLLHDGGFAQYGWTIDLSKWDHIVGDAADQSEVAMEYVSYDLGHAETELWLNTGQSLLYKDIPVNGKMIFTVRARVHPLFEPATSINDPITFEAVVTDGQRSDAVHATVKGARDDANQTQLLTINLSAYDGREVNIRLLSRSPKFGVWTLWRDPKIDVQKN